jgi:serine protease Do
MPTSFFLRGLTVVSILLAMTLLLPRIGSSQVVQPAEPSSLQAAAAIEATVIDAIAKTEKSVVAISRLRKDRDKEAGEPLGENDVPVIPDPRGEGDILRPDFVPHGFGTGVVVDAKGLILTAYHVLGDIKTSDYLVWIQKKPYKATVRAADPWLDVAILKIDADDLKPIPLGNAKELKKGQIVISLGNPYAIARDGEPSATWGIVSNLSRLAPAPKRAARPAEGRETLHHYGTLIQTDAKLELGTSGGALINLKGEMVGLTTSLAALVGYEKAGGFAIPVDEEFRKALEQLKVGRMPEYGFLGVAPTLLSIEQRQQGKRGARIMDVIPATPAAKAGIKAEDIITHVEGEQIADDLELIRRLSAMPAGSSVNLTVLRGSGPSQPGKSHVAKVVLSKKRVEGPRTPFAEVVDPPWRGMSVEYATAAPNFRDQSRDLDSEGSVAVIAVARDSAAWKAGLRPGDYVSHVGKSRVASPRQFYTAVTPQSGPVALHLTATPPGKSLRTVPAESESP